jgi:SAM-dependent methyltransferase
MRKDKCTDISTEMILGRVLDLSWRVSIYSPPMKPFIRFSKEMDGIYSYNEGENSGLFWNFDDMLQKLLLHIIKNISTPQQLANACIERWKFNLDKLYDRSKRELEEFIKRGESFETHYSKRDILIFNQVRASSRFLYVGCGAGSECLRFANRGYEVFGIDTIFKLIDIATQWAKHLALPFKPICMDVMDLGFAQGMFDFFLIEFYGYQTLGESLVIQRELARVLRKGGKGFVVGSRKQYSSFWFMSGSRYPSAMTRWLKGHFFWDYLKTQSDANEEKLNYGLYYRSQTINSLSAELRHTFNVIECFYEEYDPRYVICVVEPKENYDDIDVMEITSEWEKPLEYKHKLGIDSIKSLLKQIESICGFLEAHEKSVLQFFKEDHPLGRRPLESIPLDLLKFKGLLEALYKVHPVYAAIGQTTEAPED